MPIKGRVAAKLWRQYSFPGVCYSRRLQRSFHCTNFVCAPLDINDFREGRNGDLHKLRDSQEARFEDPGLIDKVVQLDAHWRDAIFALESLRRDFNAHNKRIGQFKKEGGDTAELQRESRTKKAQIEAAIADVQHSLELRDDCVARIGNYVHKSVPRSRNEADSPTVSAWGTPRLEAGLLNHVDLTTKLDIVDQTNGVEVAGSRGYFLKNAGLFLNQALIQYGLEFGSSKGYQPIMTPFLMRQSVMNACAQLSQFDEELYRVSGDGEEKYLIATSEQPLCALHKDQWFEEKELPLKYVGYSSSFRKEAGSHGRDTAGIFRVHQFEKVEQFAVTSPHRDASWHAFNEMIRNAEEFYQSLKIPYRVTNIVSGSLNAAAAKKLDLEAWFPASQVYRELVSCSNCLDYQARALKARLRPDKTHNSMDKKKEFVHMVNCTLSATERTLCCILENYQTPEGVRVPQVLQQYMPKGLAFLSFKK